MCLGPGPLPGKGVPFSEGAELCACKDESAREEAFSHRAPGAVLCCRLASSHALTGLAPLLDVTCVRSNTARCVHGQCCGRSCSRLLLGVWVISGLGLLQILSTVSHSFSHFISFHDYEEYREFQVP